MPLFSRWRADPSNDYSIPATKKGAPKTFNPDAIFCYFDQTVEEHLQQLHVLQRSGNREVQVEIDKYLIFCMHASFDTFKLPNHCIPHYDNLPDIYYLAIGILDSDMDLNSSLQQVLLLLRQCIPLRRRTKRAQREVQWKMKSFSSLQTIVRCMQGTLLGLYPTSLTKVSFAARMGVLTFLRSVLVQNFDVFQKVVNKITFITKLCLMEHLCNTISDYFPGVYHTLNQSGQKVDVFCNSVSMICDIFRSELNTLFCMQLQKHQAQRNKEQLACFDVAENHRPHYCGNVFLSIVISLEKIAHSYFERCTRAYRGIIVGNVAFYRHIELAKKCLNTYIFQNIGTILENTYISKSQSIFEKLHAFKLHPSAVPFAWHLTNAVNLHFLPVSITLNQKKALAKRYTGDFLSIQKCHYISLCCLCLIRKGNSNSMRLRHDCQTSELMCMVCNQGSVITMNILGNMISLGTSKIILSSCCGTVIYYNGTGSEYCTKCGDQCDYKNHFFKRKERHSAFLKKSNHAADFSEMENEEVFDNLLDSQDTLLLSVPKPKYTSKKQKMLFNNKILSNTDQEMMNVCYVCKHKNVVQCIQVLSVDQRRIVSFYVCAKHTIPNHIATNLWGVQSFQKYVFYNFTSNSLKKNGGSSLIQARNQLSLESSSSSGCLNDSILPKSKRGRKPKYLKINF